MSAMLASSSFALAFLVPRRSARRPFAAMSRMLSSCVPRKRWSIRTQVGLSQRCSTWSFGSSPFASSHDAAVARTRLSVCPPSEMIPYRALSRAQSPLQRSALWTIALGWFPVLLGFVVFLAWERVRDYARRRRKAATR